MTKHLAFMFLTLSSPTMQPPKEILRMTQTLLLVFPKPLTS